MAPVITSVCAPVPSDAELCDVASVLLHTVLGPRLESFTLSQVLRLACMTAYSGPGCEARSEQLALALATYLHERHVLLRSDQVSIAGLNAWAKAAPVDVVRTVVAAYARHERAARREAAVPSPMTGPDVMAFAAALLPGIVTREYPVYGDVQLALCKAARHLRGGESVQAHRLADEAADMLAACLVARGETAGPPVEDREPAWCRCLSTWLEGRPVTAVAQALGAAAAQYRRELAGGES